MVVYKDFVNLGVVLSVKLVGEMLKNSYMFGFKLSWWEIEFFVLEFVSFFFVDFKVIYFVLIVEDVYVDGFCMSICVIYLFIIFFVVFGGY